MEEGDEYVEHRWVNGKRKRVIKKHQTQKVILTKEEVIEIETTFHMFDKDGNESIDVSELKDAMKALGLNKTKAEIQGIMDMADKDGSGTIDMEEFKSLMAGMIKERPVKAELAKAFKMYDDDDNGHIEFDNLRKVADEMAKELKEQPISDIEVKNMIKMADRKYDGTRVDLEDFMFVMDMAGLLEQQDINKEGMNLLADGEVRPSISPDKESENANLEHIYM